MTQAAAMHESSPSQPAVSLTGGRAAFLDVVDPAPRHGLARLLPHPTLQWQILRTALPVVAGMLTQTAINILDTVMVGQLPPEVANPGQAAIGLALPFMWLVGGFLSAVWVGTQAITSRRAGEGQDHLAGRALTNSLVLAIGGSVVLSSLAFLAVPSALDALYDDPAMVSLGVDYLRIRMVGITAMVATFSFKSFFDGLGKTHVFMTAAVVMNVLNVVLNLALIFGFEPLHIPALHVAGAAWASVISAYVGLLILFAWSLTPRLAHRYRYYHLHNLNPKVMRELVRLSLPNGAATVVVMIGFAGFYWVVGQVNDLTATPGNPVVATANQALITLFMLTFMSSLAVGSATAAMVSQAVGAKRPELGATYAWESVKLWATVVGVYGLAMILAPNQLLGLINADPEVIGIARSTLQGMGLFQAVVATAIILAQTLYGLGLATFVMYVELFCHLVLMAPLAYLCGLVLGGGLPGVYVAPVVYASVLMCAMVWKFRSGAWKDVAF